MSLRSVKMNNRITRLEAVAQAARALDKAKFLTTDADGLIVSLDLTVALAALDGDGDTK
jgi:hypothetical protein